MTPAEALHRQVNGDGGSSVYTDDTPFDGDPTVSPLGNIKGSNTSRRVNILGAYNDWKKTSTPLLAPAEIYSPVRSESLAGHPQEEILLLNAVYVPPPTPPTSGGNQNRGLIKSATTNDLRAGPLTAQTDPFTPLTPWLKGQGGRNIRKTSKNLFGDHGWLQDTATVKKKAEPQKSTGFFHGIKKVAREIVSLPKLSTYSGFLRSICLTQS
jgi:hypothetical protein